LHGVDPSGSATVANELDRASHIIPSVTTLQNCAPGSEMSSYSPRVVDAPVQFVASTSEVEGTDSSDQGNSCSVLGSHGGAFVEEADSTTVCAELSDSDVKISGATSSTRDCLPCDGSDDSRVAGVFAEGGMVESRGSSEAALSNGMGVQGSVGAAEQRSSPRKLLAAPLSLLRDSEALSSVPMVPTRGARQMAVRRIWRWWCKYRHRGPTVGIPPGRVEVHIGHGISTHQTVEPSSETVPPKICCVCHVQKRASVMSCSRCALCVCTTCAGYGNAVPDSWRCIRCGDKVQ